MRSPALKGVAWMLLASLCFSSMNVLTRVASRHVPWVEVALARCMIGAAVAILVARARGAPLVVQDRRRAWGRTLCGTMAMLASFYTLGSPLIALGDVVTIRSTTPIFIAFLAPWLLKERGGWRVRLAIPISMIGIMVLMRPSFDVSGRIALVALIGAMVSAFAMLFLRKLGPGESPEAVAAHFSIVASGVMLFFTIPVFEVPDARGLLLCAATGVTAGLGQIAMTRAYGLESAARIGAIGYLDVVLSQLGAVALLNERPSATQIVGSALVLFGGSLVVLGAINDQRSSRGTSS